MSECLLGPNPFHPPLVMQPRQKVLHRILQGRGRSGDISLPLTSGPEEECQEVRNDITSGSSCPHWVPPSPTSQHNIPHSLSQSRIEERNRCFSTESDGAVLSHVKFLPRHKARMISKQSGVPLSDYCKAPGSDSVCLKLCFLDGRFA